MLSEYYKLPIVLLSNQKLKENNKSFLVTNKSDSEKYYFILISPRRVDTIQEYSIFTNRNDINISLRMVNLPIRTDILIATQFNLKKFIETEKPIKLKVLPKKTVVKKDDDDEELDEEELLKALEDLEEETPKIVRPNSR